MKKLQLHPVTQVAIKELVQVLKTRSLDSQEIRNLKNLLSSCIYKHLESVSIVTHSVNLTPVIPSSGYLYPRYIYNLIVKAPDSLSNDFVENRLKTFMEDYTDGDGKFESYMPIYIEHGEFVWSFTFSIL